MNLTAQPAYLLGRVEGPLAGIQITETGERQAQPDSKSRFVALCWIGQIFRQSWRVMAQAQRSNTSTRRGCFEPATAAVNRFIRDPRLRCQRSAALCTPFGVTSTLFR